MKLKQTFDAWTRKILQGTMHHYACCLPPRTGALSFKLLDTIFKKIAVNPEIKSIIKKLPDDAIIVYTVKHKSCFEYLCYYSCFSREGLPYPRIGFDLRVFAWQPFMRLVRIFLGHLVHLFSFNRFPDPYSSGYLREELFQGCPAFLTLVEKKDFYRRFVGTQTDPIKYLMEIQGQTKRPIVLLPLLFFFGKTPPSELPTLTDLIFGSEQNPGRLRRIFTLFQKPEAVFFEISDPLNLKLYLTLMENQGVVPGRLALVIRRDMLAQINRHRRSITGPLLKSTAEITQQILTQNQLQTFMIQHAGRRNVPVNQVRKEATQYLAEIAAKYNPAFIRWAQKFAGWLLNQLFEEIVFNREGLDQVKHASRKGPIIFIPCHKSHIDSLVLSYTLYAYHLPCPHIFAGKNLSFWPVGPLFRRFGAFFVRRSFSGAVFYTKIFSEYIHQLLLEGFNIEVFAEGTRSRSGKMLRPQLGMLSILLNAFKETPWDDMHFVPVFIGYDQVPEEREYLHEMEGKPKQPESFRQILRSGKLLKKKYGKIYLRFSQPLSLDEFTGKYEKRLQDMNSKEQHLLSRDLGNHIFNHINKMGLVTPYTLVASALLNDSRMVLDLDALKFRIDTYLTFLFSQKTEMTDSLVKDPNGAIQQAIGHYLRRKFILPIKMESNVPVRYQIKENKRPVLAYYRNNGIVYFMSASFTALSILHKKAFQFSSPDLHLGYMILQDLFSNEFIQDPDCAPEYLVRKCLKAFIDDGIIVPHPTLPDTYNMTSQGHKKLKIFAGFMTSLLLSYQIVLRYFEVFPKSYHDNKQRIKKIQTLGLRMLKRGEINQIEALSKINYENALDFFIKNGIRGSEDTEKITAYGNVIASYLDASV